MIETITHLGVYSLVLIFFLAGLGFGLEILFTCSEKGISLMIVRGVVVVVMLTCLAGILVSGVSIAGLIGELR